MERAHLALAMMTRRSTIWWLSWLLVVDATFPLSAAPALGPAPPAAGRDTVVIGTVEEPISLNPLFVTRYAPWMVLSTIYTKDVQLDRQVKPFAQGVQSLPTLQNGTWQVQSERMSLRWKIRSRHWHDGQPVTCADYVFAFSVARNPQAQVTNREITKRIANVACPQGAGGAEVVVTWKERYAFANRQVVEHGALPRHALERFYRADPLRLDEVLGVDPKSIIGDGAYRLAEWRRGESLTVEAVDNHPIFGTPKVKRIIWRFLDREALTENILSGFIDVISADSITPDQAVQLERAAAGQIRVIFEPGLIWEHIDFNLDNPFLQDIRVRRAIAQAVNRTQIVHQLFGGRYRVSHTYLPPKHPGYTDDVRKYSYNPARARSLLQEAGFTPRPDGILEDPTGRRLSLELSTTSGDPIREQVERIVQQQLQQVGIEVAILNHTRRVFFNEINPRRRFQAMSMYAWVFDISSTCNSIYTSSGIPSDRNGWAGGNFPGYRSAEMDRICQDAERELNDVARNGLLRESARIFSRDLPALPLYIRAVIAAAKPSLQNYVIPGLGSASETWNAHAWFWE